MNPQLRSILLLILLPLSARADDAAQSQLAPQVSTAIDELADAEMAKQGIVGMALGVIQNGKIALVRSYGWADREAKTPVTKETVFNWASNSKPLAAVLAMQLVERKALDLDADVRTYVPEFPEKGAQIRTRQLLCHQSGIPHYSNGEIVATDVTPSEKLSFLDPLQGLNKFNRSKLNFQPGEKTSYSSYAYVLLSAVVQRAGKQAFGEQLAQRIAEPLGLSTLQLDLETNGQQHWATGYAKNRAGEILRAPEEAHYWKHGAGGFKSNIVDFAGWSAALLNHRLVSGESEQAMWTPQTTLDGKATTFGLGFQVTSAESFGVGHGGSQDETKTQMLLDPATKRAVVVMCNCGFGNVKTIAAEIAEILNRE